MGFGVGFGVGLGVDAETMATVTESVSIPDLHFSSSRDSAGHVYVPTDVPVTLRWNLTMSPSTLMTSAFVAAWIRMRVDPDPGAGGSAVQLRDAETESTTTLLTMKAPGGCRRMHPSELPPAMLVATKETLVATPLVTEDGDLEIVQPPLAAMTSPEPTDSSPSAARPAILGHLRAAIVTVSISLVRQPGRRVPRVAHRPAR